MQSLCMSQLGSSLGVLPSSKPAFMPPKKNIIDDAKSKASKKAKKAAELPSADGGVYENEAWAAGSQEPTKGDFNNMYSAMQYEKTKHGNTKPLETYRAMKSGKDKHSFWRNFLADKKFNWLSLQESHTCTSSAKEGHIEGWLSKYQVAAEEKLPAGSELLQQLLDLLPCRAHRTASWAANGEKEYYYQAQKQVAVSNSSERQLMASRQGKITQAGFDQLKDSHQTSLPWPWRMKLWSKKSQRRRSKTLKLPRPTRIPRAI